MVRRTWKCVPCGKTFGSRPGVIKPTCPSCGELLTALAHGAVQPPIPQPRPLAPRAARASRSTCAASSSRRPHDPATAIAQSSAWVPEFDAGPSPDTVSPPAPQLVDRFSHSTPRRRPSSNEWLGSPWTWASMGGVAVALTFFIVFLALRSGPSASQASGGQFPAGGHEAESLAAPAPVGQSAVVATAPRTVNLLALIDPARHALGGNWRVENGQLISDSSHRAKIAIPYKPGAEYDFKIEFTRLGVDNCVAQMFTHRKSAALILGGWKGTASGFQQIGGKSANQNATCVTGLKWEVGKRHTSVVKVRRGRIEAWLDGNRIAAYDTDGSDLYNRDWGIEPDALGVGSEVSATAFHVIELTENPY